MGEPPEAPWKSLAPMFLERGYALRILRKRLKLPTPLDTTDREVLERRIIPQYLRDPGIQRVLFVGCGSYTAHYERTLFSHVSFATIEPDPSQSRYGSSQRHVIAPLQALSEHFPAGAFDLILCNGVYGWGLDSREHCEAAFAQCHTCLRAGGHFLFGWDDVPRRTPTPLAGLASLARFGKYDFPGFGTWRYLTDTPFRHTYDFYRK